VTRTDDRQRPPRKRRNRPVWILRKVARFVRARGFWPSSMDLAAFVKRGSRWTIRRDLCTLRHAELVRIERRKWCITPAGWEFIHETPVTPRLTQRPSRKTRGKRQAAARARKHLVRLAAADVLDAPAWISDTKNRFLETLD